MVPDLCRQLTELLAQFKGLSGTAKQKAILGELGLARASLEDLVGPAGGLDQELLGRLRTVMGSESKPPKAEALGLIGKDHFLADSRSVTSVGRASSIISKSIPTAHRPQPDVAAHRGDRLRLRRGQAREPNSFSRVNNSPALSDAGAFKELGVDGLGGILGDQFAGNDEPIVFLMHVTGARLAFTDRGKSAVSL